MGIDQAYEQNKPVIESIGGATSVLNKDDESGLAQWELCLHELSLIINDFEPLKHQEDSEDFQNQFSAHISRLKTSILTNPFKLNRQYSTVKNPLLMILCIMIFLKCRN